MLFIRMTWNKSLYNVHTFGRKNRAIFLSDAYWTAAEIESCDIPTLKKKQQHHMFASMFVFIFLHALRCDRMTEYPKRFFYLLKVQYSSCIIEPLSKYLHSFDNIASQIHPAKCNNPRAIILWHTNTNSVDCVRLNSHLDMWIRLFYDMCLCVTYFQIPFHSANLVFPWNNVWNRNLIRMYLNVFQCIITSFDNVYWANDMCLCIEYGNIFILNCCYLHVSVTEILYHMWIVQKSIAREQ